MDSTKKLLHRPVPSLLVSLAIPMIIAQLVNCLYNIVDRLYISHIPDIGTQALTGVGITFPILMLITAFSALIGNGGAPLASIRLGAGKDEEAQKILGSCVYSLTIISILLTAIFMIFQSPILTAFGASEATLPYAIEYLTIYLIGTIFVQFTLGLNTFINAQGFTKIGMMTIAIGAIINIVLDPIFIFVFDMGVKGAAWATVLSQAVSAIWVVKFLCSKKSHLRIQKKYIHFNRHITWLILSLGISPFVMNATESLVTIALNTQLRALGGDLYVGSMVVMSSIMQIVMLPLNGLNNGAQPIIGYNYGAGKYQRVRETVRWSLGLDLAFSTTMCILCVFTPKLLYGFFTPDTALHEVLQNAMPIYFAGIFAYGAQSALQNAFMSLGQARTSLILALLRKVILLIPLIYIIPSLVGGDVNSVFFAECIADILAATATSITFFYVGRKLLHPDKEKLLLQKESS